MSRFTPRTARHIIEATNRVEAQVYQSQATHYPRVFAPQVGAYYAVPTNSVNGISGAWPAFTGNANTNGSVVMASFVGNIYASGNGHLTLSAVNATIFNPYKSSINANAPCTVIPDGAGFWNVVVPDCNSV